MKELISQMPLAPLNLLGERTHGVDERWLAVTKENICNRSRFELGMIVLPLDPLRNMLPTSLCPDSNWNHLVRLRERNDNLEVTLSFFRFCGLFRLLRSPEYLIVFPSIRS